jgi:uncharacterized protein YlxP (DUF503 family)
MFIAAGKVILDYYGNDKLSHKKQELEKLLKEIHKHFNVSVAEVEDFEDFERCVIGISLTAGSEKGARVAMKKVMDHIDSTSFARVVMEDTQFFGF